MTVQIVLRENPQTATQPINVCHNNAGRSHSHRLKQARRSIRLVISPEILHRPHQKIANSVLYYVCGCEAPVVPHIPIYRNSDLIEVAGSIAKDYVLTNPILCQRQRSLLL